MRDIFQRSVDVFLFTLGSIILGVALLFFIAVENYEAVVVILVVYLSYLLLIDLFWGLVFILVSSLFIEGQLLYEFILFRLFGFNWYLMDLITVFLFGIYFYNLVAGYDTLKMNKFSIIIIFFLFITVFGVLWGAKNGNSLQSAFFDFRSFFYYLAFIPTLSILRRDPSKIKTIVYIIVGIGAIKSGIDSFDSLFYLPKSFDFETQKYLSFARLKGTNEIVYPITVLASFLLFFFTKKKVVKALTVFAFLVGMLALLLSYTRGSWLSVFVTFLTLFFSLFIAGRIKINFKKIIIPCSSILLLGLILILTGFLSIETFILRATSISFNKIDISNLGRIVEYATALEAFYHNPVFGSGLGFVFSYFSPGIGFVSTEYCHSSYLYVLAKLGLVGFIPFLLILLYALKVGYKLLKNRWLDESSMHALILVTIFYSIIIKSFTTWHLNTVTFSLFIGILLGAVAFYSEQVEILN